MQGATLLSLLLLTLACDDSNNSSATDAAQDGATSDAIEDSDWETLRPLPEALQETAVVALDGRIYVIGGINGSSGTVDDVHVYDVAMDSWSQAAKLPMAVHHANAAVSGGKIYVVGSLLGDFSAHGAVWEYDSVVNSWVEVATMPANTQRGAAAVGVIDGVIYLAGGFRQFASVRDFSSFDPADMSFNTSLPSLPQPLNHLVGQAIDNRLYVVGGREVGIDGTVSSVHTFSPGDASFGMAAAMPTARGGMASGVVGGAIVVVGGEGNPGNASGVFTEVESYDPATDRWTTLPPMKTPRHGMGAVGYEGDLFVPGGATVQGFGATNVNEVLRF